MSKISKHLKLEDCLSEVDRALFALKDVQRIPRAKRAKNSNLDFYGIRVPLMRRRISQGFSFSHLPPAELFTVLEYIWFNSNIYEVMAVPSYFFEDRKDLASRNVIPKIFRWSTSVENWCHCDGLGSFIAKLNDRHFEEVFPRILTLSQSTSFWDQRLSLVSMVHYTGKSAPYCNPESVLEVVENTCNSREKYVQLAIGWVLREYRTAYRELIDSFIAEHHETLSPAAVKRAQSR